MSTESNEPRGLEAVIATAQASVGVQSVEVTPDLTKTVAIVPAGARAEILDFDRYLSQPARATGSVTLRDLASFAGYVQRHRTDGTTLWIDREQFAVTAVLNDHEPTTPAWGDFRARLALTPTEEWQRWVGLDGRLLSQEEFGQLLEQGQREIIEPTAAEMLELVRTFYVSSSANFHSGIDLQGGAVKFRFDEDQQASAGTAGELPIPREFELALPPFIGEPAYRIRALLKWRVLDHRLKLGFKLDRPYAVIEDAMAAIAEKLRDGGTVVDDAGEVLATIPAFEHVYMGAPRS